MLGLRVSSEELDVRLPYLPLVHHLGVPGKEVEVSGVAALCLLPI